jgi:hypothetical protein
MDSGRKTPFLGEILALMTLAEKRFLLAVNGKESDRHPFSSIAGTDSRPQQIYSFHFQLIPLGSEYM